MSVELSSALAVLGFWVEMTEITPCIADYESAYWAAEKVAQVALREGHQGAAVDAMRLSRMARNRAKELASRLPF